MNDIGYTFSMPMLFVSGDYDKSCNVNLLKAYFDKISAPAKSMVLIENCGHNPQIDKPERFAEAVMSMIKNTEKLK